MAKHKTDPDWYCESCKRGMWSGRTKWINVENGLHHRSWFICLPCNADREKALQPLRDWEYTALRAGTIG